MPYYKVFSVCQEPLHVFPSLKHKNSREAVFIAYLSKNQSGWADCLPLNGDTADATPAR